MKNSRISEKYCKISIWRLHRPGKLSSSLRLPFLVSQAKVNWYSENKANLPPSRKALRPLDYSTETYTPFVHKRNLIWKIGIFVLLQFTGGFSNLRLIQEICMLTLKLDPQPSLSESKTKFDCVWSWFLSCILIHMYHLLVLYLRCLYMTLL